MKIKISGRHLEVSNIARDYISGKIETMVKYFNGVKKAEVIISSDGKGKNYKYKEVKTGKEPDFEDVVISPEAKSKSYKVEVIISAPRGNTLVGSFADKDILTAFDKVVDKMERQLTKFKEKLRTKKAKHTDKQFEFSRSELRKDKDFSLKGDSLGDMWW